MERTLGHRVAVELVGELPQDRAAEWQVTQVILERGKPGDALAAHAESGDRADTRQPPRRTLARSLRTMAGVRSTQSLSRSTPSVAPRASQSHCLGRER